MTIKPILFVYFLYIAILGYMAYGLINKINAIPL